MACLFSELGYIKCLISFSVSPAMLVTALLESSRSVCSLVGKLKATVGGDVDSVTEKCPFCVSAISLHS